MLRCAVEATCMLDGPAAQASGITRYTRCLIEALSALPVPEDEAFSITQLWRSSRWRRRHQLPQGPRLSAQMWRSGVWPLRRPYDLVHVANGRMPPWRGPAYVSTIYDLYAAFGLNHENEAHRTRQMEVYRQLGERSQRIICISEHTRRDFLDYVGADPQRVHTVHLGVSPQFRPQTEVALAHMRQRYGLNTPYLLFIASSRPNKNMQRVLEAYAASEVRHHFALALIGNPAQLKEPAVAAEVAQLQSKGSLKVVGFVHDDDLPAVYAGASAYLFPSLYEGFGLPILEAMACGAPVLTGTAGSCPEVAAGHAILVDPQSVEAIADGLHRVVELSSEDRVAAQHYASEKTWRRTAEETLQIYRLAVDHR